jgi:hypothetical protein
MRVLLIVVLLIGGPLSIWNQLTSGNPDWGLIGLTALLILCAIGGLYVIIQKEQVAKGQRDFWLNQRRK